jgi:hypothetical protein
MEPKHGGSIPSAERDPGSRKARPKVRDGEGTLAAAPAWVPYSQRAIDHQRHSRDGLMSHVANVIDEQLNSLDAQREQLPELVKPDGAGYMPLYCVAQWIVTHGGTRVINRFDEVLWREAYKVLLDRIASEDVKVLGVRDGATETVSGIHFASCSVNYPFSDARLDLILSKELCLFSRPYLDDQHWRGGFDDSLEDRRGARWRRLMVLKADVAHYWPFAAALDHRTGAPGRPSAMHLVEEEYRARWARGEAQSSIGAEAEYLSQWLANAHPTVPRVTAKTICNRLRSEHRRRVADARK